MKEEILTAANELRQAGDRLAALAERLSEPVVIDFENLSEENKEELGKLFNAWLELKMGQRFTDLEEKLVKQEEKTDKLRYELDNLELPDPDDVSSLIEVVNKHDFDALGEAADKISSIDFDEFAQKMDTLPDFTDFDADEVKEWAMEGHEAQETLERVNLEKLEERIDDLESEQNTVTDILGLFQDYGLDIKLLVTDLRKGREERRKPKLVNG